MKFAKKYIDFLRFEIGLPDSLFYVLKGWTIFDTGANWGKFDISGYEENKRIIVTVENSFLTRPLLEDKHRFCVFMTGYIEGVLWTCLNYYPRWWKQITKQNITRIEPVTIEETTERDTCRFIVTLKEEELSECFDQLFEIEKLVESDNLRKIPTEIRTVIETALKKKLGIDSKEIIYVPQLLVPFKKQSKGRLRNMLKSILDKYAWASKDAHTIDQYSKAEILDAIKIVSIFLRELELTVIDLKEQDIMRKTALDARRGPKKNVTGIFICYSRKDESFVDKLAFDISKSGIDVWLDKKEIKVGDSLIKKIAEGIDKTDYLGAILSPNSIHSGWVLKELAIATTQEIEGKQVKVLPLFYGIKKSDLPSNLCYLTEKKYLDFTNETDERQYKKALEELIDKLRE